MTLGLVAAHGRDALIDACADPADASRDASLLARWALGWTLENWLTRKRDRADPAFIDRFQKLIARRAAGEPIAYLTGEREFYGRRFEVTPAVLIPRPETELVVEEALRLLTSFAGAGSSRPDSPQSPQIADIGTGSGCLAITLALERPDARVIATDISAAALAVARQNAARLGAGGRITFIEGSLLDGAVGPFDVIVSNPPYVAEADRASLPREVVEHEPGTALFGGSDGLDVIRALLPAAAAALKPRGWLVIEIGQGQSEAVHSLIDHVDGLTHRHTREDLQGIPRVVVARRGGRLDERDRAR
jgi:release factor glutamine methyltransferase